MRNFILGTDWGEDCDDAVAVRVLARYAKAGKINLCAIGINTHTEYSAPSLYAFLEKEGVTTLVGVDKNCPEKSFVNNYQPRLAKYTDKKDEDFEDSVRVYRRAIANAEGKVEIMEIGFLQILARVLESQGDDISPKTGIELFKEKVSKVWIMGGAWNEQGAKEYNFSGKKFACRASSTVCKLCPAPITFLGWEIGHDVITGDTLKKDDYLYHAMSDHGFQNGRSSWDPMLVLMAIIGDEEKAGYTTVRGKARVCARTGKNYFKEGPRGKHRYVVKSRENSYYSNLINSIIE